jgi:hypothetical protein
MSRDCINTIRTVFESGEWSAIILDAAQYHGDGHLSILLILVGEDHAT